MTGITRSAAARIIAGHFHSSAVHVGGTYDTYTVEDNTGRKWKVVSDASIKCQSRGERTASRLYAVEMVTPICKYEDIETIQQLVRELRRGGARVNDSCGIHIHVDASRHDPKTLRNIVNIMASKEDLLYKALNVQIDRECYCQKADLRFLEDVNLKHPKSMAEFETLWYNGDSRRNVHYDYSRYHALNLHSVFSKGTVEFRMFNSTLHAGEVKSYIQLCLAISHQALVQQRAMRARTHSENEKYTFRTWLLRLGLIGDEFKTARQHLLKNLEGNIAWKDPAQAERLLGQIIVIGTYIKRRNNLIFVGVQRGSISVQELRLCLNESAENLCLYGAECSALIKGDGQLSIEQATAAYALFEAVVEAELESLRSLLVSIEVGEELHMNLCISGEAPLRHLKDPFPALEWEEDEDGLQYVMLRVEKSGGK